MAVNRRVLTLDEFTLQAFRQIPNATGELSALLRDIGLAAKRINVEVNKIGLVDMLGETGDVNVQGEEVKKMDVFANNQLIGVLKHGVSCAGIGSEEMDDIVVFDDELIVRTHITELRKRSLRFGYEIVRASNGQVVAEGETGHVITDSRGKVRSFPEGYAQRLLAPPIIKSHSGTAVPKETAPE